MSALGCHSCFYRTSCGRTWEDDGLWGCAFRCQSCDKRTCQFVCPENPPRFRDAWRELGGFGMPRVPTLNTPAIDCLPAYVPLIDHRYRRAYVLDEPVVGLTTFKAYGRHYFGATIPT